MMYLFDTPLYIYVCVFRSCKLIDRVDCIPSSCSMCIHSAETIISDLPLCMGESEGIEKEK